MIDTDPTHDGERRPPPFLRQAALRLLTLVGSGFVIFVAIGGLFGRYECESMYSTDNFFVTALTRATEVNILVFVSLSASFYALICAARGDRFLSLRWMQSVLAAVALALTAIGLTMTYFVFYPATVDYLRG